MAQESNPRAALNAALARAIKDAHAVGKDGENKFHRYRYASGEAVIAEARSALSAHGLALLPVGAELAQLTEDTVVLRSRYELTHEGGAYTELRSDTPVVPEKGRPIDKATAAAKTYDLAYTLRGVLLLPRVDGEDVDDRDDRGRDSRPPKPEPKPTSKPRPEAAPAAPPDKAAIWTAICRLRDILDAGTFARCVGCDARGVSQWRPRDLAHAQEALASLRAAAEAGPDASDEPEPSDDDLPPDEETPWGAAGIGRPPENDDGVPEADAAAFWRAVSASKIGKSAAIALLQERFGASVTSIAKLTPRQIGQAVADIEQRGAR